jgi:signal-transduction protein with cAMP-binding, CBS, and nucleotidyltransferase domain
MVAAEDVPNLGRDQAAIDALVELSASTVNRGVVAEDGRVVGILSAADLGRALDVGPRRRPPSVPLHHASADAGRKR